MTSLHVVLGDQLYEANPSIADVTRTSGTILMMEVIGECTAVSHHKQKIVLFLSSMRHFAEELRQRGLNVDYVRLDDPDNTGSFETEINRAVIRHGAQRIVMTEPGEHRVAQMARDWNSGNGLTIEILEDTRFFASHQRFQKWAENRRQWRMEHFYREMRRENHILMDGKDPAGGQWNFDAENRKKLPSGTAEPTRRRFAPDVITRDVMALVDEQFADNFGTLDSFGWPVTRHDALEALADFIVNHLPFFGDYQDAMKTGSPFLFHSLLAPALNIGLLTPREACEAAEAAWHAGDAPLNAVEGFIRQILGWREYVRGVYWTLMPGYQDANFLGASRPLPDFYWSGSTDMHCLREAVSHTADYAYSHHIQRLMLTGNFALLAGVAPHEIERWYLAVYADAMEWVEMPNTLGMAVFADGGRMASKPYAASGSYIHRMSDFCGSCRFDVRKKNGPDACPFNYLYWAFMIRNRDILQDNPRMAFPYKTLASWSEQKTNAYVDEADAFIAALP